MSEVPAPGRQPGQATHRFRVWWDGRVVAGVSRVGPLRRETDVVEHRVGSEVDRLVRSPGVTRYAPVVLERGVSHDEDFEQWASVVHAPGREDRASRRPVDVRRDLRLELADDGGRVALAYELRGCWPSSYQALPWLDANGAAQVAIQRLVLEVTSWERDRSVSRPMAAADGTEEAS